MHVSLSAFLHENAPNEGTIPLPVVFASVRVEECRTHTFFWLLGENAGNGMGCIIFNQSTLSHKMIVCAVLFLHLELEQIKSR